MKIYGDIYSGNCYKLKLICALLEIEHEWIPVDIMRGETREDHFLRLNPVGQIPICVTDEGQTLTESNAILYYLAQDSDLWPADRLAQTRVLDTVTNPPSPWRVLSRFIWECRKNAGASTKPNSRAVTGRWI